MNLNLDPTNTGRLDDIIAALRDHFAELGLAITVVSRGKGHRTLFAHPPGPHPGDNSGVGPDWIGIELDTKNRKWQVRGDVYAQDEPLWATSTLFVNWDLDAMVDQLLEVFNHRYDVDKLDAILSRVGGEDLR